MGHRRGKKYMGRFQWGLGGWLGDDRRGYEALGIALLFFSSFSLLFPEYDARWQAKAWRHGEGEEVRFLGSSDTVTHFCCRPLRRRQEDEDTEKEEKEEAGLLEGPANWSIIMLMMIKSWTSPQVVAACPQGKSAI